jgi:hypothetical protein
LSEPRVDHFTVFKKRINIGISPEVHVEFVVDTSLYGVPRVRYHDIFHKEDAIVWELYGTGKLELKA